MTSHLTGALLLCEVDRCEHGTALADRNLGLTSQPCCGPCNRGLPPQVHRLRVNGLK